MNTRSNNTGSFTDQQNAFDRSQPSDPGPQPIHVPVGRLKALTRAVIWAVGSLIAGALSFVVYSALNFSPTALSNRLVDISIALITLPVAVAALIGTVRTFAWLLLAAWPGPLGVIAFPDRLILRLGPFGTKIYDAGRLTLQYSYEIASDDEGAFEAFLPEEQQHRTLLPKISHPDAPEPIQRIVLRFAAESEVDVIRRLYPMMAYWRNPQT